MFFRKAGKKQEWTDRELIARFKRTGDNELAGILFDRYIHLVFGVCLKYLKNEEQAKDFTMQVFEKLLGQLKKHEVQNFKSWLHVLTKNHCLMHLRSLKTRPVEISNEMMEASAMEFQPALHHEEEPSLEEDLEKLETCMQKLLNAQRQCLELFYYQKKCYQEIHQQTGFELKKVKSYIQNGKRNLKICIEKLNEEA